jgi:hypothetical protein
MSSFIIHFSCFVLFVFFMSWFIIGFFTDDVLIQCNHARPGSRYLYSSIMFTFHAHVHAHAVSIHQSLINPVHLYKCQSPNYPHPSPCCALPLDQLLLTKFSFHTVFMAEWVHAPALQFPRVCGASYMAGGFPHCFTNNLLHWWPRGPSVLELWGVGLLQGPPVPWCDWACWGWLHVSMGLEQWTKLHLWLTGIKPLCIMRCTCV